jgi:hypothetical protein
MIWCIMNEAPGSDSVLPDQDYHTLHGTVTGEYEAMVE